MREISIKYKCNILTADCIRNHECKSNERCGGYNSCENIKLYHDMVSHLWEEALIAPRSYEFCGDCDRKFYICPNLILVGD